LIRHGERAINSDADTGVQMRSKVRQPLHREKERVVREKEGVVLRGTVLDF
jgi:hypothetical protein